ERRQRCVRELGLTRRQRLDPSGSEPCEVLGRLLERRGYGAAGLVRQRHGDVGPAGQRLEQRPLCARQVFESVGVDGAAVPGGEVARNTLRGAAALEIAVPELEAIELGP